MTPRLIIFFLLLSTSPCLVNGQENLCKTTVWETKEDNIFAHFVYGLTVTVKGTILAFAEARITDRLDDGAHHIVLKRSTDKGYNFSASKIIVKSTSGQSWANPTVVQDAETGTIFLFYALNDGNRNTDVFYLESNDDGLTWSGETRVTDLFKNNPGEWTFHLPGPGHGIQLKNKRLIVPVWHRRAISFPAEQRKYGVSCIYSDDHGKTWKSGGSTPIGQLNESQLIEQTNGSLMLLGRTRSSMEGSFQAKVISKDKGESWAENITYDKGLQGSVCDIGLTRYSIHPDIILVSQPADPGKRKALTIRMSDNGGKTWEIAKLLQKGAASYSDLGVLPDKTIVCLYGSGNRDRTGMPDKVILARFNVEWLKADNK